MRDGTLQIGNQLGCGQITALRLFLHTFLNNLIDRYRNLGIKLSYGNRLSLNMQKCDRYRIISRERHLTAQHLVQRYAKRIDIAALVAVSAPRLFRRQIMNRSHGIGGQSIRGCRLGDTEICYLNLAIPGYDNILRLNIAVNDMSIVRRFHSLRNLNCNSYRFLHLQPALSFDELLERNSLHKLHNDVIQAVILSYVIYVHNIRMRKSRDRLRFRPEFCNEALIIGIFRTQDLDCNIAVQPVTFCLIDICHTAGTHFINNLISVTDKHSRFNHLVFTSSYFLIRQHAIIE